MIRVIRCSNGSKTRARELVVESLGGEHMVKKKKNSDIN